MVLSPLHIGQRSHKQVLVLAIMALTALIASAQKSSPKQPYALLFGTIWNAEHRPVAGVTIRIRRTEDKKARWTLMSDRRGEFAQRVPAGAHDYVVWVDLKGRKPLETTVHIDNDERVDFGLHLTE